MPAEDTQTLAVGKHKGKTFTQIFADDPGYVAWVKTLEAVSGSLNAFKEYCIKRGPTSAPAGPLPAVKKRKSLAGTGSLLDELEELVNTPKRFKQSRFSEWLEEDLLTSINTFSKGPEPKQPQSTSLSEGLSDAFEFMDNAKNSETSNRTPAQGWISTGKNELDVITLNEKIALEVVSPDHFRVLVEKSGKRSGGLTPFLPRNLWDFVNTYKSKSATNNGKNGTWLDAVRYGEFCEKLRQTVTGADVQQIPGFVLRAFPAFLTFAPKLSLQRKCANILLGISSPRTQAVSVDVKRLMGEALTKELKVFQMDGVLWGLRKNGRCLIGDEMGLGKTLQALGLIAMYRKEWPAVIICPSSIRFQWKDQASRWLSHCFDDLSNQLVVIRNGKSKVPPEARIIIISYELICKYPALQAGVKVIVCDESHYLKSATAKRSQIIVPMLQAANRSILLSGTPALNKPSELYQQIAALLPDFAKADEFSSRYCEKRKNPWSHKLEYFSYKLPDELNVFLTSTVMIRRLKKDVQKELPEKLRSKVPMEIPANLMREIKAKMTLMQNAPLPEDLAEDENTKPSHSMMSQLFRLTGEAKVESVCDYLDYLLEVENRFIVFAHHKVVLDPLERKLREKKVDYVRIDGSTPQGQREGLVKKFQETNEARVALLSITACGHGLNLTAASTAVFAELYWVPGQIMQAEDRCHRMGTTHSTINIHYCIAENTLDDQVWNLLNSKWSGLSSSLNGCTENFRDDKDATYKQSDWRTKKPTTERKVIECRSSILITEDDPVEDFVLPEQPTRERQSVLDSFFAS